MESERDKSRGIKHLRDKKKYKGNTIKNPKYVPEKSQPNLGSNWDRYENEGEDNQNNLPTGADFAILADAPVTKGKHFQTKSDKLLARETESTSLNGLFTLNLEKLEESLMTIPFYKRVNIDKKYFLADQIEFMNGEAEEKLENFNLINNPKVIEDVSEELNKKTEELIEVLNILEENKFEETKQSKNYIKNEELEQWLDDFLNE